MRRGNAVVVVLPFQTPGKSGDEALIAEGLVEDISSELTRFATLEMLAASAGREAADLGPAEIGDRLGVTHLLQGSLRRAGDRLRISVRLVECASGAQTWSERFDVPVNDIFAVQDETVARIAAMLVPRLEQSILAAARRRPADIAAYTLTLEGFARLREGTLEADDAARAHFQSAIEIDPAFPRAHVGIALSWFNEWSCQFWDRFEESTRKAYTSAHRALALDDRDGHLHQVLGKLHLYWKDWERASWYFDRALELCPNDPDLLIQQSLHDAYLGRPEVGVARAERAMRLNPAYPGHYPGLAALVHLIAGDFAAAVELGNRSTGVATIDVPAFWAIACAHLGQIDAARAYFARYESEYRAKILFGQEPQPGEAIAWFFEHNPFRRDEHVQLLVEGFRRIEAPLSRPISPPVAKLDGRALFARLGEGWAAGYEGRQVLLPDLKGFGDIQRLLERPGEEIHCLDLAERLPSAHGGDEMLDDRARAAIKARIRDLQEEIAEAEDRNDIGRTERLRAEFDTLVETLSQALGLGGRSRRLGSLAERARTTVTWRIRHAMRRIEAAHPELGRHFRHSLRTGAFCSYSPERTVAWRLVSP